MDESFSRIVPSHRVGNDGFNWWIGQVEGTAADEENNKGGLRYKVAIVGEHPADKNLLDTSQLPWANVMMPVTHPFTPGAIALISTNVEICFLSKSSEVNTVTA